MNEKIYSDESETTEEIELESEITEEEGKNNDIIEEKQLEKEQKIEKRTGRPKKEESKKKRPKDKITCDVCGKIYIRQNGYYHKKTKHHILHQQMVEIIKQNILNYERATTLNDIVKEQYIDEEDNIVY